MTILLLFQYDSERALDPFLLERVGDRVLRPNPQLFHRVPPRLHCDGAEQQGLKTRISWTFPASA
jgi:hypothetical protein